MREYIINDKSQLRPILADVFKILLKRPVRIKVSSTRGSKTHDQLGYYYSSIIPAVRQYFRDNGYHSSETTDIKIHLFLKDKFFTNEKVDIVLNREIRTIKSLADATIEEMSEYLEEVIQWAGSEGIDIPEPIL